MPKLFNRADTKTARKTLHIYWQEMRKDKRSFALYTTLIPLNRLLYVVILPLLFSFVLQSLIQSPHNWQLPAWLLVVAAVVSIGSLITSNIGFRRLFIHEEEMRTTLTETAITSLIRHSDQFFASRKVGTLSGNVDKFSGSILSFLDVIYLQASGIAINFGASLLIIAILSPILLLPLGLVTGLVVWRSLIGTTLRGPVRHKRKVLTAKLNGTVADILGNQQIVRFFATEKREVQTVLRDRREIEAVARHEIEIIQHEAIVRQAMLFAFQILTLAVCIWLYAHNSVTIAALVFAITYLGRLTSSLFDISPMIRSMEQAFLDAADITDILNETPEVIDADHAKKLVVGQGAVTFDKVRFAYQESQDEAVIRDLSLTVAAGERIGLAGFSGGGKTTLTKLLLRFADINSGSIMIDGQDIRHVSQESLRASIAYVPQEPYLFHRSLRENIAYGRPDATDEEIYEAVARANAAEFVDKLPRGLDTLVGERGVKLSGGQRQRIAIARAILKDAPILVLDEATSALDSESEQLIQQALEKLMRQRTSIVIAHRLSTIAKLDRIIVLDNGQIVEDGTHKTLLGMNGIYAKLWSHQSGGVLSDY
jgi:ATP-binding cassette subfamily B protein